MRIMDISRNYHKFMRNLPGKTRRYLYIIFTSGTQAYQRRTDNYRMPEPFSGLVC